MVLRISDFDARIGGVVLKKRLHRTFNFSHRNHVTGGRCPSKAAINGKTVVITGANTGIGKETAQELAKRGVEKIWCYFENLQHSLWSQWHAPSPIPTSSGGRIIMGCRNMKKCEAAAKDIRGKTMNPHVYACHLDLASVKSIRAFAERIKQGEETYHVHWLWSLYFYQ